jgi:hypothetical protein
VTFAEGLLAYFDQTEVGRKYDMNREFFFSDVLDVQNCIKYGENQKKREDQKQTVAIKEEQPKT